MISLGDTINRIIVDDVLKAHGPEDQRLLVMFWEVVLTCFADSSADGRVNREQFNFYVLNEPFEAAMQLDRDKNPLLVARWVIFLRKLMTDGQFSKGLKYKTIDDFEDAYCGRFEGVSEEERARLWATANWMSVFVGMVPARRSKCLALKVVPRLVEGFSANYVQGSGQTQATNNRVLIFEQEGAVVPHSRKNTKREQQTELRVTKRPKVGWVKGEDGEKPDRFSSLGCAFALQQISAFLRHDQSMGAAQRWALMEKTALLPSSSAQRNVCLNMLSKVVQACVDGSPSVELRATVATKAIEEMYQFDRKKVPRSSSGSKRGLGLSPTLNSSLDSHTSGSSSDSETQPDAMTMLAEQANIRSMEYECC